MNDIKFEIVEELGVLSENDNITKLIESKMTTLENEALCEPLNGDSSFKVPLN